jgi:uncharacterized protein YecT (DUF1311 family)
VKLSIKPLTACLALLAGSLAPQAHAQDSGLRFDCAAAATPVETLICGDRVLAELDRALADGYYAALATRMGEAQMLLREEQRAWMERRAVSCSVDGNPAIEANDASGCLIALYRARIAELLPGVESGDAAARSGYGWLMGEWAVVAIHTPPTDPGRADAAKAQLGRVMLFTEGPVATIAGASCSFPRYSAEPAPGPQFGDLSDYPVAVMVRVSCVGIALLDVVRLTDEEILVGEGAVVFALERRRLAERRKKERE